LLAPAHAEQSFFGGEIKLPSMPNFQRFSQPSAKTKKGKYSFQRWSLNDDKGAEAVAYLLANPGEKLWLTIRSRQSTVQGSAKSPLPLKDFDKNLVKQLKTHNLKASTTQFGQSAAGSAVVYQFREGLAKGYHAYLVCLTPTVDNSPKNVYFLTIVCTDSSKSKAIKLVETILKRVWIAPS
jgi:hypothetical protein